MCGKSGEDLRTMVGCVLDESGKNGAECSRKVMSRRRVAGAIRSLVNARNLQLKCANLA